MRQRKRKRRNNLQLKMNLDIIRKAKANKKTLPLRERNGLKVLKPVFQKTPNAEESFFWKGNV